MNVNEFAAKFQPTIKTYLEDWTLALPNNQTVAFQIRAALGVLMATMRMEATAQQAEKHNNYRNRFDAHAFLQKNSSKYRAYIRLQQRLNLLLRYYGFDGGKKRESATDLVLSAIRVMKYLTDPSPEELALMVMMQTHLNEHCGENVDFKEDFPPNIETEYSYDQIRQYVLENFTGNKDRDLGAWTKKPEFWVAQDEWQTERIRRERAERKRNNNRNRDEQPANVDGEMIDAYSDQQHGDGGQ